MDDEAKMSIMADPRKTPEHTFSADHDLMTVKELASFFRVSTGFVYKLAKQNRIPTVKIGRSIRFDLGEVEKALSNVPRRTR